MLRIRFLRVGKKNSPSFRLVVTPKRSAPQTGSFLEVLGFYNPTRHEQSFKKDRIEHWLSQGAQPSDTARNMLIAEGIMQGEKVAVHKKAAPKAETASEAEETKAEALEKSADETKEEGRENSESQSEEERPSQETPANGSDGEAAGAGEEDKNNT